MLSGHADSGDGHDSDGEVAQSIKAHRCVERGVSASLHVLAARCSHADEPVSAQVWFCPLISRMVASHRHWRARARNLIVCATRIPFWSLWTWSDVGRAVRSSFVHALIGTAASMMVLACATRD